MTRMPTISHAGPLVGLALRCQPDTRLVSLFREGHDCAFEEIVRRYRSPLVRFAAAIVPTHRAEDVVQEALAGAHSRLTSTDATIQLKAWLYTIVRNRALNDLRDEPRHQTLKAEIDGVTQPPEVVERRAELAELLTRIGDLPAAQREALVRRELEGRSHLEIAAAIGVSPGAVRGLIFRARSSLRDLAGILVPVPVLRALLNGGPWNTEAAGAGVGGAAAGLGAGSSAGAGIKVGAVLFVAAAGVGSGVALHNHGHQHDGSAAMVAQAKVPPRHESRTESSTGSSGDAQGGGRHDGSGGGGSSRGPGSGDAAGHHSGDDSGGGSSGPGPSAGSRGSSGRGGPEHHGGRGSGDGSGDSGRGGGNEAPGGNGDTGGGDSSGSGDSGGSSGGDGSGDSSGGDSSGSVASSGSGDSSDSSGSGDSSGGDSHGGDTTPSPIETSQS
jgi:RNA polymerase sigma factor (sigma-70 family)